MSNCAFLTIQDRTGWFIDDDLVKGPLGRRGWQVQDVAWDAAGVDWDAFDMVVIRSTWDYQHQLDPFLDVLQEIENSSAMLLNPMETVKWNACKDYLFALQAAGVPLVPTCHLHSPSLDDVLAAGRSLGAAQLIIKPLIGANASETFRWNDTDTKREWQNVGQVFSNRSCLVQPFLSNIICEGEYSLIYFNGQFSHSVLKTVQAGDFRVQEEHGGGVVPIPQPPAPLLEAGARVIHSISDDPLYARVDLVRSETDSFLLMELELIEPSLYFRFDDRAASRFAEAIDQRYRKALQLRS